MLGFLIIYFAWYKPFKDKIQIWEIQNTNELMVANFKHLRVLGIFAVLFIVVENIQVNIQDIRMVLFWIILSLLLGWALKIFSIDNKKSVAN
jgi:hypothetical protein